MGTTTDRIAASPIYLVISNAIGGEGGIRTPDTVARMPHFECGAIDKVRVSGALLHEVVAPGRAVRATSVRCDCYYRGGAG
jgi:hypothetical protein